VARRRHRRARAGPEPVVCGDDELAGIDGGGPGVGVVRGQRERPGAALGMLLAPLTTAVISRSSVAIPS